VTSPPLGRNKSIPFYAPSPRSFTLSRGADSDWMAGLDRWDRATRRAISRASGGEGSEHFAAAAEEIAALVGKLAGAASASMP